MDIDNAATILAGSILCMLSFVVIVIGVVVINNIFHKYWKPVEWMKFTEYPPTMKEAQNGKDERSGT
jgi:hypothetical protein